MKPITVGSVTYPSIAAAWRDVSPQNLKLITVRLRLRKGWNPDDAFLLPTVPAKERRLHKNLRTLS